MIRRAVGSVARWLARAWAERSRAHTDVTVRRGVPPGSSESHSTRFSPAVPIMRTTLVAPPGARGGMPPAVIACSERVAACLPGRVSTCRCRPESPIMSLSHVHRPRGAGRPARSGELRPLGAMAAHAPAARARCAFCGGPVEVPPRGVDGQLGPQSPAFTSGSSSTAPAPGATAPVPGARPARSAAMRFLLNRSPPPANS